MAINNVSKEFEIGLVVASYCVISITMVFVNKLLLAGSDYSMNAPFFITWYQCVVTAIICYVLGMYRNSGTFFAQFPEQKFDVRKSLAVLPLTLLFVGMISFNNLCLQFVHVSFYLVARSLTIVFNVLLTYILLNTSTSSSVMCTLAIVIFGFFLGSEGEVNFNLLGTIYGVLSSLFVSLNAIYTKKILHVVDDNKWTLAFYNNVNASILFLIPIFAFEYRMIYSNIDIFFSFGFWFLMNIAGIFGFLIGIVTIIQINVTSPLTHNIVGTAKAALQTLLAFIIWKTQTTYMGIFGLILILFGSTLYSYIRTLEMDKSSASIGGEGEKLLPISDKK